MQISLGKSKEVNYAEQNIIRNVFFKLFIIVIRANILLFQLVSKYTTLGKWD